MVSCASDGPELRGPRRRDNQVVWLGLPGVLFFVRPRSEGPPPPFAYLAREGHKGFRFPGLVFGP